MAVQVLTIAGASKTFDEGTMQVSGASNGRSRFTIDVTSVDGSVRPAIGETASVADGATVLGFGLIRTTRERGFQGVGLTPITTTIEVADYATQLERRFVKTLIPAGTVKAQLTHLAPWLLTVGVTVSASQADGPSLPERDCDYTQLSVVVADIAAAANYVVSVDISLVLLLSAAGGVSAPFNVTDANGVVFGDLEIETTREGYANRIILRFSDTPRSAYAFLWTDANWADTETVTIGSRTYTFQSTLTDVDGHVLLGATIADSLAHLCAAITLGAGAGTLYATATTLHDAVSAYVRTDLWSTSVAHVSAVTAGAAGNSVGVSTTNPDAEWRGEGGVILTTLQNGADQALTNVVTVDDLAAQAAPTGVWEAVYAAESITSASGATTIAEAIVARTAVITRTARYSTYTLGAQPGMVQTIVSALRHVNNTFLIQDVSMRDVYSQTLSTITAVEGSVPKADWRDTYRAWGGGSSAQAVSGAIGGGGGAAGRSVYPLATSASEAVQSPTPTWVAIGAIQVQIDTTVRGTTAAVVVARVRARTAGVSVTARLRNVSDGATVGTQAVAVTSTDWTLVTFACALTPGAKLYALELLPSVANEDVQAVGYVE